MPKHTLLLSSFGSDSACSSWLRSRVPVPVVDVREVRVTMGERLVNVSVSVRITKRIIRGVGMLVMSVMGVRVSV